MGMILIGKSLVVSSKKQQIRIAGNRAREGTFCAVPDVESQSPGGVQTAKIALLESTGVQTSRRQVFCFPCGYL
jgi:hypothetical protein